MGACDMLMGEHEAMVPLIAAFRAALDDRPDDLSRVPALRWAVIRALLDHFAHEENDICAPLVATGNAAAISVTLGFRQVQGAVREEMMAYQSDWPAGRIARDWDGFHAASMAVLARVQQRMNLEESELYPQAERLLTPSLAEEPKADIVLRP
jgi:hypothetical protein